jgi:hypothetical protein
MNCVFISEMTAVLMKGMFSTRSVPRCKNPDKLAFAVIGLLVFSRCELLLLAEDRDRSGTQRKNIVRWEPPQSNGSEDKAVDINLCNTAINVNVITRCM